MEVFAQILHHICIGFTNESTSLGKFHVDNAIEFDMIIIIKVPPRLQEPLGSSRKRLGGVVMYMDTLPL
jgi:hypothetical protein